MDRPAVLTVKESATTKAMGGLSSENRDVSASCGREGPQDFSLPRPQTEGADQAVTGNGHYDPRFLRGIALGLVIAFFMWTGLGLGIWWILK